MIRYQFCVRVAGRQPPTDKLKTCSERAQLVLDAQVGGTADKGKLKKHDEGKFLINPDLPHARRVESHPDALKTIEIEIIHVSEVLIGGSCVPDRSERTLYHAQKGRDSAQTDL